jgi:creatinine amidohydrolase/Fe(II)-dependent formamide hydrolase-like protein
MKRVPSLQGIFLTALDFLKDKVRELDDVSRTWMYAGDHAAEWETSLMLEYFPALVDMKKAPATIELDMPGLPEYIRKRYPRRASREYGRKIRRAVVSGGVDMIGNILDQTQ